MTATSRTYLTAIAAFLLVAVATLLVAFGVGLMEQREWLWCPARASAWIADEHYCQSFLVMSAYHVVAETALFVALLALFVRLGWKRSGPFLALIPMAWLALFEWEMYQDASDLVSPGSADKMEFFGAGDRSVAMVGALALVVLIVVALRIFKHPSHPAPPLGPKPRSQ